MPETTHFVLSDCVQGRIAAWLAKNDVPIVCAKTLHDVNCKECRRQIEQVADGWLHRWQTRLSPLQHQIRRNADTIKYQEKLIEKLDDIINGRANYAGNIRHLHSRRGDRCPECGRGSLVPRRFRDSFVLACDQWGNKRECTYAVPYHPERSERRGR